MKEKTEKSLRFSFFDGLFANCMNGFTTEYFTPFLLVLGGMSRHVAALSALPNLFASLVQLKTADLIDKVGSRKKIVIFFVFLQSLMLIPMVAMAAGSFKNPGLFILLAMLFTGCSALATPAWGSLMSDLVDEAKRGEYFGRRNRTLGFVSVIAIFLAGIILHLTKGINAFIGFSLIFSLALVFRLVSLYFLNLMQEPPLEYKKENCFTLVDFFSRLSQSNFAKFVVFVAAMNFSVNIASPFFAVLMLRDLGFDYLTFTVITLTAPLTVYFAIGRWGRQADKIGNLKVLRFVSPIIGILPFLWILNRHPAFLLSAQVISGFAWAGFNISASNFILDAVSPGKRARCISYFNVCNGLALSIGAFLGGFLLQKLPGLFGFNILSLFLISSFLRLFAALLLPKKLKEVRVVEKITNSNLFFSIVGVRPLIGVERKTLRY